MIRKTLVAVAAGLLTLGMATGAHAEDSDGDGDRAPHVELTSRAEYGIHGASDCPSGYVCVWDTVDFSGKPDWKSKGNLYNKSSNRGLGIYNNGTRYPGADHIHYRVTRGDGSTKTGCLHYPPDSRTWVKIPGGATLDYARWGGEC